MLWWRCSTPWTCSAAPPATWRYRFTNNLGFAIWDDANVKNRKGNVRGGILDAEILLRRKNFFPQKLANFVGKLDSKNFYRQNSAARIFSVTSYWNPYTTRESPSHLLRLLRWASHLRPVVLCGPARFRCNGQAAQLPLCMYVCFLIHISWFLILISYFFIA